MHNKTHANHSWGLRQDNASNGNRYEHNQVNHAGRNGDLGIFAVPGNTDGGKNNGEAHREPGAVHLRLLQLS